MKNLIEPVEKLISEFSRLPSVGRKTAVRFAYFVVNMKKEDAHSFAKSILEAKEKVHFCRSYKGSHPHLLQWDRG